MKQKLTDMTIAEQLGITEFPFEIKDSNGNLIYFEQECGYWSKRRYNANGEVVYYENSVDMIPVTREG